MLQSVPKRSELESYQDLDACAPFYGRVKTLDGHVREGRVTGVSAETVELKDREKRPGRLRSIPTSDVVRIQIYRSWPFRIMGDSPEFETVYDRSTYGEVRSCLTPIDWADWPDADCGEGAE